MATAKQPTIADLVTMHESLLVFLEQKFNQIDQRFEQVDQRFEQVDQRLLNLETRVGKLEESNEVLIENQHYLLYKVDEIGNDKVVAAERSRRMEKWIVRASKKLKLPYEA